MCALLLSDRFEFDASFCDPSDAFMICWPVVVRTHLNVMCFEQGLRANSRPVVPSIEQLEDAVQDYLDGLGNANTART